MWSHLSLCAGVPVSSDNEGLSIFAMDRAHQKGGDRTLRKAITNTPLFTLFFTVLKFKEWHFTHHVYDDKLLSPDICVIGIKILCSLNMSRVNKGCFFNKWWGLKSPPSNGQQRPARTHCYFSTQSHVSFSICTIFSALVLCFFSRCFHILFVFLLINLQLKNIVVFDISMVKIRV